MKKTKQNLQKNVGEVEVHYPFCTDNLKKTAWGFVLHVLFCFIVCAGIHEDTQVQKVWKRRFTTSKSPRLLLGSSRRSLKMKLTLAHTLVTFSQRTMTFLSMLKAMHQVLLAIEHQPISS